MVVDFILGRGIQCLSRLIEEMILHVKSGAQEMFWNKLMSKMGIDLDLVQRCPNRQMRWNCVHILWSLVTLL